MEVSRTVCHVYQAGIVKKMAKHAMIVISVLLVQHLLMLHVEHCVQHVQLDVKRHHLEVQFKKKNFECNCDITTGF